MSDSLPSYGLYNPPGSSVHGILQARKTNLPKEDETHSLRSACTWEVGSLTLVPPGKPTCTDGQMTSQSTDLMLISSETPSQTHSEIMFEGFLGTLKSSQADTQN